MFNTPPTRPTAVPRWTTLLFLVLALACAAAVRAGEDAAAVAQVHAGRGAGCGTLILREGRHGWLLTAAHVVDGHGQVQVIWADGTAAPARVIAADQNLDVAILQTSQSPQIAPIPLAAANEWPAQGEIVELIGYGGGRLRHWSAKVNGYALTRGSGRYQTLSVATETIGGDSGGAMIYRGKLVGVIWGGPLDRPRGRMLATHGTCCVAIEPLVQAALSGSGGAVQANYPGGPPCIGGNCPLPPRYPPVRISPPAARPPITSADLERLSAEIARLQSEIAALQQPPPPVIDMPRLADEIVQQIAGDARFRGPPGQDGPPGRDGRPGRDAEAIDIGRLAEQVKQRISGSVRVRVEPVVTR